MRLFFAVLIAVVLLPAQVAKAPVKIVGESHQLVERGRGRAEE